VKNSKKLEAINKKIAELTKKQIQIESKTIDSVSKQVASLLIKKRAANIDIPAFLKKIEAIINETNDK
jgi:hypothetical protein